MLVNDFFTSATEFIPPGGQIHMALLKHQAGMNATSMLEWKRSWMVGRYASESQLLLTHILAYEVCYILTARDITNSPNLLTFMIFLFYQPGYNLSSYQFRDRPFLLHGKSQMYIFTKPDNIISASKEMQCCSFFSLFIAMPSVENSERLWSRDEILDQSFVKSMINNHIPEGIDAEVIIWRMHLDVQKDRDSRISAVEYRVCFSWKKQAITISEASNYKHLIEQEVQQNTVGTRNGAWCVSKIIPSFLLSKVS